MLRFPRSREPGSGQGPLLAGSLGHLESEVMDVLWHRGACCVHEVVAALKRRLAYTTVMTTLDRLFKKGLLGRKKQDRAFIYSPLLTRAEWERRCANDVLESFLRGPEPSRELLLSCFLEAVGDHDSLLLDELERRIRRKRQQLGRRGGS